MTMVSGMASIFNSLGCNIVAVTRETPEESSFMQYSTADSGVTMITDPTNAFGNKLDMDYNATEEMKKIYEDLGINEPLEGYFDSSPLDVPTTFIIGSKNQPGGHGRILYKFAKRDYTIRAPGSAIIRELTRINQTKFEI